MKSSVLRAVALASSMSIGVFLVARANSGCSAETQSVAQPEVPLPAASAPEAPPSQPAAVTAEEHFFQGSKAPGGTGLRPPAPAASSGDIGDEEFMGTSKSGRLIRRPSPQPNAPNPPEQQK